MKVGVKENICIKGEIVSAGAKMLENYISPYSSTIIEKIENTAELSKIKMTEFGFEDTDESVNEILNGNIDVAIESDVSGGTRIVSSENKLFGFKPTYGLVSRYGLISVASSLEQISIIAKSIDDLVKVIEQISGYDKKDSGSVDTKLNFSNMGNKELKDFRIATCGVEIKDANTVDVEIKNLKYTVPTEYIIEMAETSSNLARYDGIRYGYRSPNCNGIDEVYYNSRGEGFGEEAKKRNLFGTYFLSVNSREKYYDKAQKIRKIIKEEIMNILSNADCLITEAKSEYTVIANLARIACNIITKWNAYYC